MYFWLVLSQNARDFVSSNFTREVLIFITKFRQPHRILCTTGVLTRQNCRANLGTRSNEALDYQL